MVADTNTRLCDYIDSIIGTDDTDKFATVIYKDGHQDTLQLSAYDGTDYDDLWKASIQFSPYTELYPRQQPQPE